MVTAVYFLISLLGLLLYVSFMILKFSFRIKVTKFVVFLHILTAFIAFLSFFILFYVEFSLTIISFFGVIFILVGLFFIYLASNSLRSQTFVPGKKLVITGIYAHVRNPMYLGIILLSIGSIFFSLSIYLVLYSIVLVIAYLFVISAEEKELSKRLGKPYDDYRKKVPSLIPKF